MTMPHLMGRLAVLFILSGSLLSTETANADFTISLQNESFVKTGSFNNVTDFNFSIVVDGDLRTGIFSNPMLDSVEYNVTGDLTSPDPIHVSQVRFGENDRWSGVLRPR